LRWIPSDDCPQPYTVTVPFKDEDPYQTTLYVATTNAGKLRDFARVASDLVSIAPLPGLATISAPAEDAPTFEGNAEIKAIYYSMRAPGWIVLADDSGLEVDTLSGAPGVRSARYADDLGYPTEGDMNLDQRNNACLLQKLASVPVGQRQGRYRCALVAAQDGAILYVAYGSVEGEILTESKGEGGFGYDPLFYLPQFQKTMAELDQVTRLACSHRGNALRKLLHGLYPTG
jgi:XTP/dITP diphosphohydrolase